MKKDLKTRLKPAQLKELRLISAMIAKGEPLATIENGWKKFMKKSKNDFVALKRRKAKLDICEVIQHLLSEAYLETSKDLQFYAQKVKYFNDMKKQIRDEVARARKAYQDYIDSLEEQLSTLGDDSQLANIDLQNLIQKQQQAVQMLASVMKMMHDTATAIIRNLR